MVESTVNCNETHSDKMCERIDISDIGKEALIHWNGPPLARADRLGKAALDRVFGRGRWNFIIMTNKGDSLVTKRLREEERSLPFFS